MNALTNVAYFLVDTLFDLYLVLIVVRFLLGMTRADFYNPISQFVVTATNPVVLPLRKLLPPIGKIDTASIVALVGLKIVQVVLLLLIKGVTPDIAAIIGYVIIELIVLVIYVFMFSIIILAVMSWVNPQAYAGNNPLVSVLTSLTRPIMQPISRIVPRMGMFDLSPLAALLLLQVLLIVVRSF
ncbi:MAG TPA: YggT family protein [Gammaproteobacteria bacterium]|nr:YggT family protein [Gammaproteobacteria bacterium]